MQPPNRQNSVTRPGRAQAPNASGARYPQRAPDAAAAGLPVKNRLTDRSDHRLRDVHHNP